MGPQLEGFTYPYPLHHFPFISQGVPLAMGYMDIPPQGSANGKTVVLLHGKNFCAATWEDSIKALSRQGYRVIAPDQIGFCTSSKPAHYQYSFQQLATNTHVLLLSLGIDKAMVVGHSTGGMLATRYALMYPAAVQKLVLVNPIGLEDWKALGVPYRTPDQWYARGIEDFRGGHPPIRTHHLLCGPLEAGIRPLGGYAGRFESRSGTSTGCLEFGVDLRHDFYPAGSV